MLTVLPTDGTITATAECAASSIAEIQKEEQERKQRNERLLKFAKTFGSIPGVEVGDTWSSRAECPVHRVPMQGIHGSKDDGCYSIAISNLYKYDSDFGETVIYTGSGGFEHYDPKSGKRRRTGPQVRDQQWSDFGNMSLYVSRETGNPVRVIRSWKTVSKYAPAFGYRYDGLYTVKDAWKEQTENGFKICRYRLERLPGQPPLPEAGGTSESGISATREEERKKRTHSEMQSPAGESAAADIEGVVAKKRRRRKKKKRKFPVVSIGPVPPGE